MHLLDEVHLDSMRSSTEAVSRGLRKVSFPVCFPLPSLSPIPESVLSLSKLSSLGFNFFPHHEAPSLKDLVLDVAQQTS